MSPFDAHYFAFLMDISVVIPLYNEAESLPELTAWIERVMSANGFSYEIIFVNDGSSDNSMEVIRSLAAKNPSIHAVSFSRNYGKSPALNTGFARANGDVVITMDADLQDSPDEIPELYRMIAEEGYDLVSGWKKKRYDPLSKTIPTKLFNATDIYPIWPRTPDSPESAKRWYATRPENTERPNSAWTDL